MKYFHSRTEAAASFKEWLWLVKSPLTEIMGSNGRGKKKTNNLEMVSLKMRGVDSTVVLIWKNRRSRGPKSGLQVSQCWRKG